jgi:hypothetical protein
MNFHRTRAAILSVILPLLPHPNTIKLVHSFNQAPAIKTSGRVDMFLTSALEGSSWQVSSAGRFTLGKNHLTVRIGG